MHIIVCVYVYSYLCVCIIYVCTCWHANVYMQVQIYGLYLTEYILSAQYACMKIFDVTESSIWRCEHDFTPDKEVPISVCALCGNCSEKGVTCHSNAVRNNEFAQCGCKTSYTVCNYCSLCRRCIDMALVGSSSL